MKAIVGSFNQEKALVGAFSVITNLRMELFQALLLPSLAMARVRKKEVPDIVILLDIYKYEHTSKCYSILQSYTSISYQGHRISKLDLLFHFVHNILHAYYILCQIEITGLVRGVLTFLCVL